MPPPWGCYGWGNHTAQLVQAVDAVETSRGFKPPTFVDNRIRRSVRAVGFTGSAFGLLTKTVFPPGAQIHPSAAFHCTANSGFPTNFANPSRTAHEIVRLCLSMNFTSSP